VKYTGPKVRLSRQLGIALTPKAARVMEKKAYPPGMHGKMQQFKRKESDYRKQLVEKQRLRAQYNVHERQLQNYFRKAAGKAGNTVDNLVELLETRLDLMVLRAGLARTIYAARQYVSHGHFEVNGKRVNIPSYNMREGDTLAVREKSRNMPCFADALESTAMAPSYLSVSPSEFSARLVTLPKREDVNLMCEISLVIEFYSR